MGKSSSAPAAPDPTKTINLQTAADKNAFNYQTDANRYNTTGPTGSTTWSKAPQFDSAAYTSAMQKWHATGSDPAAMPTQNDYTSYNYTQNNQLSPEQQKLFDATQSGDIKSANIANSLTDQLAGRGSFQLPGGSVQTSVPNTTGQIQTDAGVSDYQKQLAALDPAQYNKTAGDAVYNAQKSYFDEDQKQQQGALEARLAEQGFVPGTPGYAQAMNQFQDNANQSLNQLRNQSTTQGFSVGNQQFGNKQSSLNSAIAAALQGGNFHNSAEQNIFQQNLQGGQFANTARNQQIAELLTGRNQPLNELSAFKQGSQVANPFASQGGAGGSSGGTAGGFNGPNVADAYNTQYKGQLAQYNADVATDNANTQAGVSALATIAAIFASDEDLKEDFSLAGETESGTPVYDYTIAATGESQRGVKAQDLLERGNADAVHIGPSGYYLVDYSKVR